MTKRRLLILLAISLLATCAALSWRLGREPHLRGADAYYYALQGEYWAKTGEVKIPDPSPVHRLIGSLQRAGGSGEASVRAWEVFSLLLLGLGGLSLAAFQPDFRKTLLWFCLTLSPSAFFTAIEFPKFFSAILFVPLWFTALRSKTAPRLSALALAGLSVALHRAALPLSLAFAVVVFLPETKRWRFSPRSLTLSVVGAVIVALLGYWVFRDRLSFDQARPGLWSLLLRDNLPLAIKTEIILSLVLLGTFVWKQWKSDDVSAKDWMFPIALCLPALFPFGTDEIFGVGERYAVTTPILLWTTILFLSSPSGEPVRWTTLKTIVVAVLALALPLTSDLRLNLAHPKTLDPDTSSFEALVHEVEPLKLPMLIARKDFVFFYKYRSMREAFPYEPEDHWDKARIWRLTYAVTPEEFRHFLPERCGWENGLVYSSSLDGYAWIREDCWTDMRSKIRNEDDADLYARVRETWLNPSQKRPAFLYPKHTDDADEEFPALKRK